MASDQQGLPILCLIFLILGGIVFAAGVALPYWLKWSDTDQHAGLWHFCGDSCNGLHYDSFSVPGVTDTEMRKCRVLRRNASPGSRSMNAAL
jgi:hypothetical protein